MASIAMISALTVSASIARANVLLNTWTSPCGSYGTCANNGPNNPATQVNVYEGLYVVNTGPTQFNSAQKQSLADGFNSGSDRSLTAITVYMWNYASVGGAGDPNAGVILALEADVAGAPSDIILNSVVVHATGRPADGQTAPAITVSDLSWALDTNTNYWLVALGEYGANYLYNESPYTASWAFNPSDAGWFTHPGSQQDALTLTGSTEAALSSVPEPASLSLVGAAIFGLASLRRGRQRRDNA